MTYWLNNNNSNNTNEHNSMCVQCQLHQADQARATYVTKNVTESLLKSRRLFKNLSIVEFIFTFWLIKDKLETLECQMSFS